MASETTSSPNFLGFDLPDELIAHYPLEQRDSSRMLLSRNVEVVPFKSITDEVASGDLLILNDTKVQPARLTTYKKDTSGKVSLLVFELQPPHHARCMYKSSHPLHIHQTLVCGPYELTVVSLCGPGQAILETSTPWAQIMEELGAVPLPPYLKRSSEALDKERYQSVWAKETGSSAAPTASLHFTPAVLDALTQKGVRIAYCTLHVGLGTFLPVRSYDADKHVMHQEWFCVPGETLTAISQTRATGNKVIAVGTTVVRALESVPYGQAETTQGLTDIFIRPGFQFKYVDKLLTNFHQVDTTLILLVQAFAGIEKIGTCYKKAVAEKMRLYSYGDCILLDKETL